MANGYMQDTSDDMTTLGDVYNQDGRRQMAPPVPWLEGCKLADPSDPLAQAIMKGKYVSAHLSAIRQAPPEQKQLAYTASRRDLANRGLLQPGGPDDPGPIFPGDEVIDQTRQSIDQHVRQLHRQRVARSARTNAQSGGRPMGVPVQSGRGGASMPARNGQDLRTQNAPDANQMKAAGEFFRDRYNGDPMSRWMNPEWIDKTRGSIDFLRQANVSPDDAIYSTRALVRQASAREGSRHWAISTGTSRIRAGHNKCNEFVGDMIVDAGRERPEVPFTDVRGSVLRKKRDPSAKEWATRSIPGYSAPLPLSMAKPGDIIAMGHDDNEDGHVGILVGPNRVASANAKVDGTVTINDWGFRPSGENGEHPGKSRIVVRKWKGR